MTSCHIEGLSKYFKDFVVDKVDDVKLNNAKEEIFSCEQNPSRKTSFSISCDENYKEEDISDSIISARCIDYEDEAIYELPNTEEEIIYEITQNVQGGVNANDELSGLLYNAGSDHLVKREFEFLDFEDQEENEVDMFDFGVEMNNTTYELFI